MHHIKTRIRETLSLMQKQNRTLIDALSDYASLSDYAHLVHEGIWTEALQTALNEHEQVFIPASPLPYLIDDTVVIPSNRHIEAEDGALIRLTEGTDVLMLRNEHTQDGTHAPIPRTHRDDNIAICGGRWEESHKRRAGYGKSGKYDAERSFYGVSTCMLFNNMAHLTLENMTFAHTAGFAVQMGDITDVVCENIAFDSCYADGIHINGNTERVITRKIFGQVGDDLVALNMYDWQDSSVNFDPVRTVLCEDLDASGCGYKAMRILPGIYRYADGTTVDCALYDAIISDVQGLHTFKLYFQTPAYHVGSETPEAGEAGSGGSIFFENIDIDLFAPVDGFSVYRNSDPVRGAFAGFEINSNISYLSLENIRLTRYEHFPMSFLLTAGPKSVRTGSDGKIEVFDPNIGCTVDCIHLKNILINGEKPADIRPYLHEIIFDHLYDDAPSTARGSILRIEYEP